MKSNRVVPTLLVALTIAAAGCGPSRVGAANAPTQALAAAGAATQAPATAQAPATQAPPEATPSGPATVAVGTNPKLGNFLVDDKGMTLYVFSKDSPGTSACTGKCATNWPALLTAGNPIASIGVDASKFGTLTRADGNTQVTYKGWPLYHFAKDAQPGDTMGQGFGGFWSVISPAGDPVK